MDLEDLTDDELSVIASFLDDASIVALSLTSTRFVFIRAGMNKERPCTAAISHGYLELLIWLRDYSYPLGDIYSVAARHGHLHILKYAKENGCMYDDSSDAHGDAALNGNLEVLQWCVKELGDHYSTDDVLCGAIASGNLGMVTWIVEAESDTISDFVWIYHALHKAVKHGHLHIIEWLVAGGSFHVCYDSCVIASKNGHLEVLVWLIERGYQMNVQECLNAAEQRGHKHIVEWINNQSCM